MTEDQTEQLVTAPTAILARKKGFDWKCRDGYEWYMFNGKEYGPTELSMPEIPDVTMFSPEEREHPANKELMRTLALRKHALEIFFKNEHLAPLLYARPTQDLLERWLREVKNMVITIKYYVGPGYYYADLGIISRSLGEDGVPGAPFSTYELAREAALQYALKLLPNAKTKKNNLPSED